MASAFDGRSLLTSQCPTLLQPFEYRKSRIKTERRKSNTGLLIKRCLQQANSAFFNEAQIYSTSSFESFENIGRVIRLSATYSVSGSGVANSR